MDQVSRALRFSVAQRCNERQDDASGSVRPPRWEAERADHLAVLRPAASKSFKEDDDI